jgi:hypothetical protein
VRGAIAVGGYRDAGREARASCWESVTPITISLPVEHMYVHIDADALIASL